jgi:hypothetical protein
LLELARGVGSRSIALLLALRDADDAVFRRFEVGPNGACVLAVLDLDLLAVRLDEPRDERLFRLSPRSPTPTFQYSSGTNASISRSRSTMSLSATDCTRPALSPNASLLQTSADTS